MTPRLSLRNVSKSFGNVRALTGVSFDVHPGEVHVVAGENGAGKSTLIKILSGVHHDYEGDVLVDGSVRRFANPLAAASAGIATIHQELSLVGSLSVTDNVLFGAPGHALSPVRRRDAREHAISLLSMLGLTVDPDALVETFRLAERQLFEIARALGRRASVFVMDEPTSALAEPEAERLFSHVQRLVADGASVVYISHRIEEMKRLANRITVLRDGRHVVTRLAAEMTRAELVHAMVGREERASAPVAAAVAAPRPFFEARGLTHPAGRFRKVSFELGTGEILGVAGLEGAGAGALVHALAGADGALRGDARLEGKTYLPGTPRDALAAGVALVPGDREASVFSAMSVAENATLTSLARYSPRFVIDRARERADTEREGARLRLRAPSLDAPAAALSGGNQQKLALVRCLLAEPRLLLLDDPTRGVDVGAKAEIHELLRELARGGTSMLFRSTELDELLALSSRVLVFHEGRLAATLSGTELTRERILGCMLGAAA
ncbi:MAG TPA: sugar ABC transporter ATP-binding protein [Polyangiaceae bacterium]